VQSFKKIAILANTTLFILFGRGIDGTLSTSMFTIDVSNISSIAYIANYGALNNSTESSQQDNSGLSKGAIGGIAAGCVIVVSSSIYL
jgi:hypothetical protein